MNWTKAKAFLRMWWHCLIRFHQPACMWVKHRQVALLVKRWADERGVPA